MHWKILLMKNILTFIIDFKNMLRSFQLKAARSVTRIEVREIALYLGVSRTIISRWEKQPALNFIKTKKASPQSLLFFFKQHKISFPDNSTIHFDSKLTNKNSIHLTRFQLRASRSILDLTQQELALQTNTSRSVVNYLETQNNEILLDTTNKHVDDLTFKKFFEDKGIVFPDNFTISIEKKKFY